MSEFKLWIYTTQIILINFNVPFWMNLSDKYRIWIWLKKTVIQCEYNLKVICGLHYKVIMFWNTFNLLYSFQFFKKKKNNNNEKSILNNKICQYENAVPLSQ